MILLVGERANGTEALDVLSTSAERRIRHGAFRWGPSRDRLVGLGLRWDWAANLLPRMPTKLATWKAADRAQAAETATNLVVWAAGQTRPVVVLAGRRVADSFGLSYDPLVEQSIDVDDVRVPTTVIPHPSGMCRWWNESNNVAAAREAFRRIGALETR